MGKSPDPGLIIKRRCDAAWAAVKPQRFFGPGILASSLGCDCDAIGIYYVYYNIYKINEYYNMLKNII